MLEAHRRPNHASKVLALVLRRLSEDFLARWGHPVLAVETFTDPTRHSGTCYKASNFSQVGYTSGYARGRGHFVHHGSAKAYWLRTLRRDGLAILSRPFDHPAIARRSVMDFPDLNALDISGLIEALGQVPDPRKARGIRHQLPQVLAVAELATLRGATSLIAIGQVAAELPGEALRRLGCFVSPSTGDIVAPEESTIRRILQKEDRRERAGSRRRCLARRAGGPRTALSRCDARGQLPGDGRRRRRRGGTKTAAGVVPVGQSRRSSRRSQSTARRFAAPASRTTARCTCSPRSPTAKG